MHPMLEEMASAFTELHPSVLVEIRGGGSALGEERVLSGRSTVAASTLLPVTDEPALRQSEEIATSGDLHAIVTPSSPIGEVRDRELDGALVHAPVGIDGIAIVVRSDNPVDSFTSQQLQDVFSGRILDWHELDGDEGEIILVSREDGSGAREAFEKRIMDDKAVNLTAVVMPTSGDVVDYVSKNRRAIGYVSTAYVTAPPGNEEGNPSDEGESINASIQVATVDGVAPSDETIRDQTYPLIQPLYLVTSGPPQGWVRQFIDFTLSPAGQAIVDRHHVPIR